MGHRGLLGVISYRLSVIKPHPKSRKMTDWKKQFIAISECDLEGKASLYFEQIERRGESVKVLVVDAFEDSIAFDLWEQRAYLVSAARQLKLSRYCLVKCRGHRFFGLAMMGVEDYPLNRL